MALFSLAGKKVAVAGAGGHLGRAICKHLVDESAHVFALDLDEAKLTELQQKVVAGPGKIECLTADLSSELERSSVAKEIGLRTDRLDGFVFAAGYVGTSKMLGWSGDFAHQTIEAWRKALELNLTAPFHLTQLLAPLLRRGSLPSVVNIGSIYAFVGPDWNLYRDLDMANPAGYSASKGGLLQLTRWLSSTLAPEIRVNCVSPGGIARDQHDDFVRRYVRKTPLRRMATERDVVGAVAYLLSGASSYVTGQQLVVDGGLTAL